MNKPQERQSVYQEVVKPETLLTLTREELEKLERQLIPLLNTIRKLLGKGPVAPWT